MDELRENETRRYGGLGSRLSPQYVYTQRPGIINLCLEGDATHYPDPDGTLASRRDPHAVIDSLI